MNKKFLISGMRNIVLILMIIVFIQNIYNFKSLMPYVYKTAIMSEIVSVNEFDGIFIRNEETVTYSGQGILSYNISDGEKLNFNTVIADVYPDTQQIARNIEIERLKKQLYILKQSQNFNMLELNQTINISNNIRENYLRIIYNHDISDYNELQNIIDILILQISIYQIITKQVLSFEHQINDINTKILELEAASIEPIETVKATKSSYFVSYCDGYESELTPEKMDQLTIAGINSITDDHESHEKTVVGKLIYGYHLYIVGVIDNSMQEYSVGKIIQLQLEDSDVIFDAKITDIRNEVNSEKSIIIIQCEQLNYNLFNKRVKKCNIIIGRYKGLKVPREAIIKSVPKETYDAEEKITSNDMNYEGVYIQKASHVVFRKIDIIYECNNYVISSVHPEDTSYLALYDDIITESVKNYEK